MLTYFDLFEIASTQTKHKISNLLSLNSDPGMKPPQVK